MDSLFTLESTEDISSSAGQLRDVPAKQGVYRGTNVPIKEVTPLVEPCERAEPTILDIADLVISWRKSPLKFVREALGVEPSPQQKLALQGIGRSGARVTIKSGHGTGKSTMFSWVGLWGITCFDDIKVVITAPTAHQLQDVLWAEFRKWAGYLPEPWASTIEITTDMVRYKGCVGFCVARTGRKENPEALQGFHAEHLLFLVDEASGVPDVVFHVAQGTLSTEGARIMMAANPTRNSGYFYDSFNRDKERWDRFTFSCLDSPLVSKDYPVEVAETYGIDSDIYRVRVLGEFASQSERQFIPVDLANNAMGKFLREDEYNFAPVIIGVDVAMFGGDRSVIMLRQGLMSKILFQIRGIEPEKLASIAINFADEYKADGIIVDAIGVGQAVISAMHLMNRTPIAFVASRAATLPNCMNARAEVWWKMRDWLKEGGSIPPDDDLRDDLVAPEYSYNLGGKLVLEKKADMLKRGINSPDMADALAITFGAAVLSKSSLEYGGYNYSDSPAKEWEEYNPLDKKRD